MMIVYAIHNTFSKGMNSLDKSLCQAFLSAIFLKNAAFYEKSWKS